MVGAIPLGRAGLWLDFILVETFPMTKTDCFLTLSPLILLFYVF